MTAWVYILECADSTLHVASTTDPAGRLTQHHAGEGAAYTRRRRPLRLIWTEQFDRVDEAFAYEKKVQGWGRAKTLALMESGGTQRFRALSTWGTKPSTTNVSTAHLPALDP